MTCSGEEESPMHEFKCEDALEMERELELFWPSVDLDSWLADLQIFGHTHTP